jgi:hypothetical protein
MHMKILTLAAAALLIGSASAGWAQSGTVQRTPGHMMQDNPRSAGPGASEYAPGHLKRSGTRRSTSASKFTPSHRANVGMSTERRTSTRTRMGTRTRN